MAYAETEDLNLSDQRLIELTDSAAAPGVLDQDILDRCLVESQAIVDAILAPAGVGNYADGSVPPLVVVCTSWIWAYRIHRHREAMEIPESIEKDYERALQMLADMAAGIIGDGDGGVGDEDAATSSVPSVTSRDSRCW